MDEDDRVLGAMAETNAQPFEFDTGEVELADFDDDRDDRISFKATIHLAGEQDEESLFNGDAIELTVSGVAVRTGNKWTFSEIEVEHVSTNT
jgi:hypothetical protein